MPPSLIQLISGILHKPRYLALIILIPLFGLLYHQWIDLAAQSNGPIRVTGGTTHSPWEGLAGVSKLDEEEEKWRPGMGNWLGWKQDTRRTLLITGGAGQIGQSLIPTLSQEYAIHVIDIAPRPSTFSKSVIYHRESILPSSSALSYLFSSTSFDGVIHLASVSLNSWCEPKENECHEVNVGGTKAVLDQIEKTITKNKKRVWGQTKTPWIIFASSMEVYPQEEGVSEVSGRNPKSALGRTKYAAETVLDETIKNVIGETPLNGMILRFSEVYGYPHYNSIPESFIPSLLTNALTSLPIQYNSDTPSLDLLHIDDAIKGILKAVSRIEDNSKLGVRTEVEEFNLVYGKRWQPQDIVELVRTETRSMSPLRDIGDKHSTLLPDFSRGLASEVLGWEPEISAPVGLGLALQELSEEIAEYSRKWHQSHCSPTPDFPTEDNYLIDHFVEDERNRDLTKLDKCTVNLAFDHEGWLHHVKCEDGRHCTADGQKVTAMNWNQSVFIVHKIPGGMKKERTVRVVFEEEKGMGYLGYRKTEQTEEVGLELFDRNTTDGQIEFDIEVNRHASYLRLLIPDTGKQIHALSNTTDSSTWFTLEPTTRWIDPHFDMRMNVLCCPSEGDWPLLLDDYESADMRFGSTGQIPFNSSRRLHLCGQAEQAVMYNFDRLSAAKQAVNKVENDQEAHVWKGEHGVNTKISPHSWAMKDLPACYNDCNSPAICVQTGTCKCVQADHCQPKRENPILSLYPVVTSEISSNTKSHLGSLAGYSSILVNSVNKTDWRDILLPQARDALMINPDFIKVHVADGYKGQDEIEASDCHKLQTKHCFSADSIMYKALRHMQVPAEEAELVVIPVYQQCKGTKFLLHDGIHHAMENIPGVKSGEKTMALVLTHDWGICVSFSWEIWSAREQPLYPDWILNNVLVWSVMGDYDSPCYRPHQDVVIPARTCQSINLRDHFPDVQHIKPVRERSHLLTWSGTYWGTGKSDRLRLTCDRGGAGEKELIKGKGPQSSYENWDYMNDLNDARFCPQPRGIAGWSPRTNDAIFSGCIPVLIAEGSHYPFASFLDWSKFSVRIAPTELDRIEEILSAIPLWKVEEMQANLVTVREAFIYSTDEKPEDEFERMGPMFFALHEAGMRVRTRYPIKEEWEPGRWIN